jgi:hypothetical protein
LHQQRLIVDPRRIAGIHQSRRNQRGQRQNRPEFAMPRHWPEILAKNRTDVYAGNVDCQLPIANCRLDEKQFWRCPLNSIGNRQLAIGNLFL